MMMLISTEPNVTLHVKAGEHKQVCWRYDSSLQDKDCSQNIILEQGAVLEEWIFVEDNAPRHIKRNVTFKGKSTVGTRVRVVAKAQNHVHFEIQNHFLAPDCHSELSMASLVTDQACVTCTPTDTHSASGGHSFFLWHSVLRDRASADFAGLIDIKANANKVTASQHNRNLLLSGKTCVKAQPRLAVIPNDVTCSHGSASGPLSPVDVYYLQSRGFEPNLAEYMILTSFLDAALFAAASFTCESKAWP